MTKTKALLPIDARVLARIDRAARRLGLSRSAFPSQLAARKLGGEGPGPELRARRATHALDALSRDRGVPEEAPAAIRADRDSR